MADARIWFALTIREPVTTATAIDGVSPDGTSTIGERSSKGPDWTGHGLPLPDALSVILDDFAPIAIEDLQRLPLPPGGLWDPTCPPPPDPPPGPLAWRVFFATAVDRTRAAGAVRTAFPAWSLESEDVDDGDWAARSQRAVGAITAGAFVVAPPWDVPSSIPPGHTLVIIEPSRGFGTGHHQSTRLCLRALSSVDVRGLRVLDLGTGSGVLALAAALRGAARVIGVDIDPDALESAQSSHQLNPHAAGITWRVADFRQDHSLATDWDVVLANLTGGMLRSAADRIRELLAPNGLLIASGFDETEQLGVEHALQLRGRTVLVEDTWIGLVGRR